jgi:hypothetical protein
MNHMQVFPIVALVHDIHPRDNPAVGHLCLYPIAVALRAVTNACISRRQPTALRRVHKSNQQQDPPSVAASHSSGVCASLQQALLATAATDTFSCHPVGIASDGGFGRMRGGHDGSGPAAARSTHAAVHDARNADVQIYINGEFFHRSEAKISVFDSGFLVGDGIWEGVRLRGIRE